MIASTSASAARSRVPHRRPARDDQQPGSDARCGSAAQSASVTNGITGWSSRRYVSSDLDERPPRRLAVLAGSAVVGQADLGELEAPVAELVPDRLVDEPGHLAEGVRRPSPRRPPRPSPRRATAASARPGRGGGRRAGAARRRRGSMAGRAPTTYRVAFQSLFAKFRAFSSLAVPKRWSLPGRGAVDQREAEGIRAGLVDDAERVDDVALRLRHLLAVAGPG